VVFFCLVVQETPLLILAAALASVDSRTEARSAPATINALLFFIPLSPFAI